MERATFHKMSGTQVPVGKGKERERKSEGFNRVLLSDKQDGFRTKNIYCELNVYSETTTRAMKHYLFRRRQLVH